MIQLVEFVRGIIEGVRVALAVRVWAVMQDSCVDREQVFRCRAACDVCKERYECERDAIDVALVQMFGDEWLS